MKILYVVFQNNLPPVQTLFERAILHIRCKLVTHALQCPAFCHYIYHTFATSLLINF